MELNDDESTESELKELWFALKSELKRAMSSGSVPSPPVRALYWL